MRKWVILIIGIFLVFAFVEIGYGDECEPNCNCKYDCTSCSSYGCYDECSIRILGTSTQKRTWYYATTQQKFYDFNSQQYYKSTKTFTNRTYECKHKREDCGCGVSCNSWVDKCYTQTINCKGWQECNIDGSCDDSTGCDCVDGYCKGWCMDNAPVYDGIAGCSAASDDAWVATTAFPSKPAKYKLNTDYHPANMDGGCYCNYYEINNHYECDHTFIKDSHPCYSDNCAPDFISGKAYCCPSGGCSHKDDIFGVKCLSGNCGVSGSGDIKCYGNGKEIQYQGYRFKCNNGEWNFVSGENGDFSDNCGKTIYNFPLYFDLDIVYPLASVSTYGYKNSYAVFPVSFEGKKDVVAHVIPDESFVEINVSGISGGGDKQVKSTFTNDAIVKFSISDENKQGEKFNLTVNCYTPDEEPCDYPNDDCWPTSYCSQDSPTNIVEDKTDFYCCPDNECAHSGSCYLEGARRLEIPAEPGYSDPPELGCWWKCEKNRWEKRGETDECEKKCDCSQNTSKLNCVKTFYDSSKSVCCPVGMCGVDTGFPCLDNGKEKDYKSAKYTCRNGVWEGTGYKIADDDYTRFLFSNKTKEYFINLKIDKTEFLSIGNDDVRRATVYIFFDSGNFVGNIKVVSGGNTLYNGVITNSIEIDVEDKIDLSTTFIFPLRIEANLDEEEYFFYLGSALIIEY